MMSCRFFLLFSKQNDAVMLFFGRICKTTSFSIAGRLDRLQNGGFSSSVVCFPVYGEVENVKEST